MRQADNDNEKPRMAAHGEWIGDEFFPDTPFHKLPKTEIEEKRKAEWRAMHKERARLAVRMKIGKDWDGKADNDNIAWPLATSLVREGNTELLKTAMAYRRIYDSANSDAVLGGSTYTPKEGKVIDYVSELDESTGRISYGKARKSNSADAIASTPARRKNITNDATLAASSPVPKPWNGDRAVNDMIDNRGKLADIRSRLGVLVEPLELAVVEGKTYQSVGNSIGVADRSGSIAAGRSVVHLALIAARDAIGEIRREDIAA